MPADQARLLGVFAALACGTLGAAVQLILPVLLAALGHDDGFSQPKLGVLSSAELGGLMVGSAIAARFVTRLHPLTYLGIVVSTVANTVSVFASNYGPLLLTRVMAGLGAGALIAVCYATLGRSKQVERWFAIYVVVQSGFAALAIEVLPWIAHKRGVAAIFALLAILNGSLIALVRYLPKDTVKSDVAHGRSPVNIRAWIGLGGIFAFFLSQGSTWAYLQIFGVDRGLDAQRAATALSVASLVALSGPLFAAVLGKRAGDGIPIGVGTAFASIASILLIVPLTAGRFMVAACLCTTAWSLTIPYQVSAIAALDPSGRLVSAVATVSLAGLAAGPMVGALILQWWGLIGVIAGGGALIVLSAIALLPALIHRNAS
jgi:predicted MFS family arabinose efflux permease